MLKLTRGNFILKKINKLKKKQIQKKVLILLYKIRYYKTKKKEKEEKIKYQSERAKINSD